MSEQKAELHIDINQFAERYFKQQESELRWRTRRTMLIVFLIVLYTAWAIGSQVWRHFGDQINEPYAALVKVMGPIAPNTPASIQTLDTALTPAFEDEEAEAVVLLINSPGGTPAQSMLIYERIKELKAKHNKPVLAFAEDMATSGAYLIAMAADDIYSSQASAIGSIGVKIESFGFTDIMDKLGIERRIYIAGDNKVTLDPYSQESKAERDFAEHKLKIIHQQFIDIVKDGRADRIKAEDYPELFSGKYWTGQESLALGLIDGISTLQGALESKYEITELKPFDIKQSLSQLLSGLKN